MKVGVQNPSFEVTQCCPNPDTSTGLVASSLLTYLNKLFTIKEKMAVNLSYAEKYQIFEQTNIGPQEKGRADLTTAIR